MSTILIAGGTGLIGNRLSELLTIEGHQVTHLSRTENLSAAYPAYAWDLQKQEIDERAVLQADYIINLAGAGIADKPWSKARKELIISSRTQSTALLLKAIEETKHQPKAYLASAAIGIYGDRGDKLLTEESAVGKKGFLAESCIAWEAAIKEVEATGLRTVTIRIGVVLANGGGAFPKMTMSLPFGVAPYFGFGQQWYSWIHIDDLARMFIYAINQEELDGIYNGVAPHPEKNKALVEKTVKASGKKALVVPTPAFALRVGMGEMADVVLSGAKISSQKIEDVGFEFLYPKLEDALAQLFGEKA
ncbi:MAG: TIGR01777 family oxidoreductase [Bacteroidota bacterium]